MPAPKSRLRIEERPFAPVDNARKLYAKTLKLCLKMPKRYTYLVLQNVIELAARVRDNAKAANSVFPTNAHEAQIRRDYWIHARAALQSLALAVDSFLDIPDTLQYRDGTTGKTKGITVKELEELADLINREQALLTKQLKDEHERFKNLT